MDLIRIHAAPLRDGHANAWFYRYIDGCKIEISLAAWTRKRPGGQIFFYLEVIYSEINMYPLRMIKKQSSNSAHNLAAWAVHPGTSADLGPPLATRNAQCV